MHLNYVSEVSALKPGNVLQRREGKKIIIAVPYNLVFLPNSNKQLLISKIILL